MKLGVQMYYVIVFEKQGYIILRFTDLETRLYGCILIVLFSEFPVGLFHFFLRRVPYGCLQEIKVECFFN